MTTGMAGTTESQSQFSAKGKFGGTFHDTSSHDSLGSISQTLVL